MVQFSIASCSNDFFESCFFLNRENISSANNGMIDSKVPGLATKPFELLMHQNRSSVVACDLAPLIWGSSDGWMPPGEESGEFPRAWGRWRVNGSKGGERVIYWEMSSIEKLRWATKPSLLVSTPACRECWELGHICWAYVVIRKSTDLNWGVGGGRPFIF